MYKKAEAKTPIEGPVAESGDVSSTHRIMFYKSSLYPGTHFMQKLFPQIYLEEDQPDKNGHVSTRLCMRWETALWIYEMISNTIISSGILISLRFMEY